MSKEILGERVGRTAQIVASTAAVIFDSTGERVLIVRRSDNRLWCLPGGAMDAGESIAEACAREVLEETGLVVEVGHLIGVYSNPDFIIEFDDGNRVQAMTFSFQCRYVSGVLSCDKESTDIGYFSSDEIAHMAFYELNRSRIQDALANHSSTLIR
jgi:8-oxo-dGTP pyrophosphatase MutT (NUDIX family)